MTREPLFTVPVGTTLDAARDILHRTRSRSCSSSTISTG
jgi:hypothetical protein